MNKIVSPSLTWLLTGRVTVTDVVCSLPVGDTLQLLTLWLGA